MNNAVNVGAAFIQLLVSEAVLGLISARTGWDYTQMLASGALLFGFLALNILVDKADKQ